MNGTNRSENINSVIPLRMVYILLQIPRNVFILLLGKQIHMDNWNTSMLGVSLDEKYSFQFYTKFLFVTECLCLGEFTCKPIYANKCTSVDQSHLGG